MTSKKSSANLTDTIVSADATTGGAKVEKVAKPRPAEVILITSTGETLGQKWQAYFDGAKVDCSKFNDDELKAFTVGYLYDIPQHKVKVRFVEAQRERDVNGEPFDGAKVFYKVVATFADGTTCTKTDTGDNIRRLLGIGVNGTAKTNIAQMYLWFSGKGAELNSKVKHPELNTKFAELAKLVETLRKAEIDAENAKKAEQQAQQKSARKVESATKQVASLSTEEQQKVLMAMLAGLTPEQRKALEL